MLNSEAVAKSEFESNEQPQKKRKLRYVAPDDQELNQMGVKSDLEVLQLLDAVTSNQGI